LNGGDCFPAELTSGIGIPTGMSYPDVRAHLPSSSDSPIDQHVLVLPTNRAELPPSALPAKEVTKVALRLKYQIEEVIPCELEEWKVTKANSPIVTKKVVRTAKEAGGKDYAACVVYCLLVCKRWFKRQALLELWDSDMHDVRATACEVIAKQIIEGEEDQDYLMYYSNDTPSSAMVERQSPPTSLKELSTCML
jgi:hypothetical protein